ncbi:lytic murein transglycosylase [Mesorhizobium japonicum R7A]|nr:lytic murein transglycosylase [Mesorhizobium japonicum R7A]
MLYGAPLCPAGHLPHKGGDRMLSVISLIADAIGMSEALKQPISPLVGEMSGRTEGGAKERNPL